MAVFPASLEHLKTPIFQGNCKTDRACQRKGKAFPQKRGLNLLSPFFSVQLQIKTHFWAKYRNPRFHSVHPSAIHYRLSGHLVAFENSRFSAKCKKRGYHHVVPVLFRLGFRGVVCRNIYIHRKTPQPVERRLVSKRTRAAEIGR